MRLLPYWLADLSGLPLIVKGFFYLFKLTMLLLSLGWQTFRVFRSSLHRVFLLIEG